MRRKRLAFRPYDFPEESVVVLKDGKIQLGENFDMSKPIEGTFSFKEKGKEELTVGKIIITAKTEILATIPFKTKYVESNNLNFGKTKVQK